MPDNESGAPLRVLVIGCGSIGERHTRNLRQTSIGEILVHDPDHARMTSFAQKYDASAFGRLEDAYAAGPQVVFVCAPTSLHLPLARQALLHLSDVFVEKPVSHTLEGIDDLIVLAGKTQRVLMVGYNLRFNPCLRQVKEWLE